MQEKRLFEPQKWVIYPDVLASQRFGGYNTKEEVTQIKGLFPIGQNIDFVEGNGPTPREGCKLIGTKISGVTPVKRAWRFERRDGLEIEMKAYGTGVYYRIEGVMDEYALLKDGFTPGLEFCFAILATSTQMPSQVNFCNGVDPWYKWNGAYGLFASLDNAAHTITLSSPSDMLAVGWNAAGSVTINGVEVSYTSILSKTGKLEMTGIPTDGQTLVINGVTFTFKNTLTGVAGQILIAANNSSTEDRLIYFLNNPGVTNAEQVALSAPDQATIANIAHSLSGLFITLSTVDGSALTVTENLSNATYTAVYSSTLIGCSDMSTVVAVAGDIVAQLPEIMSGLNDFRGSVGMAHDGRIHARDEKRPSVSNYSKLNNPNDWTAGTNDGDGDGTELEQGGPITAYGRDESKIYVFKKRQIKTLEFKQTGDRVDYPFWGTLKPTDDKSSTVGALNQKSTFSSPNGVIFVTEDKEMLHLTRDKNIDYPQLICISDDIRPTMHIGVHDEACGIVWRSKVFYAYKQDTNSAYNDVVLVYDLIKQRWNMPYIGWNVNDWTIINNKLRWHSSSDPNTYELQSDKLDVDNPFTTILRTHAEDFGSNESQKTVTSLLLELYMSENTELTLDILYDEDGSNSSSEVVLKGTDTDNRIGTDTFNPFGASEFGSVQFGSNVDLSGMRKYRYIIPLKPDIKFFNISLQFMTDGENDNYELVRYGYFLNSVLKVYPNKFIKNINS